MRVVSSGLAGVVANGSFNSHLVVTVLHGTTPVVVDEPVDSWSLSCDLGRDPKSTGVLRFVHQSVRGESWVPEGTKGVLSPYKATVLLTLVVSAGQFEERVQLGLFDVVGVPFAEDSFTRVGGRDVVVASTVDVEVESLDGRVLGASLRSPQTISGSAVGAWRKFGLLPVLVGSDVTVTKTTFPAEQGSRTDLVQTCARMLGGVPVVDSTGAWVLRDGSSPVVVLQAWGDQSTVIDITHQVSLDGFANVVVGNYETERGTPLYSVAVAEGDLSPDVMGREIVRYHTSDMVRTRESANQATRSVLGLYTSQEVDVPVVCVKNPVVEVGDRVSVEGWVRPLVGVAQKVQNGDGETTTVVVRVRRQR